jgi:hypothetical protein
LNFSDHKIWTYSSGKVAQLLGKKSSGSGRFSSSGIAVAELSNRVAERITALVIFQLIIPVNYEMR